MHRRNGLASVSRRISKNRDTCGFSRQMISAQFAIFHRATNCASAEGFDMAENNYKHGEMDISDHTKTFDGFVKWSIRVAAISIGIVIFLALFAS